MLPDRPPRRRTRARGLALALTVSLAAGSALAGEVSPEFAPKVVRLVTDPAVDPAQAPVPLPPPLPPGGLSALPAPAPSAPAPPPAAAPAPVPSAGAAYATAATTAAARPLPAASGGLGGLSSLGGGGVGALPAMIGDLGPSLALRPAAVAAPAAGTIPPPFPPPPPPPVPSPRLATSLAPSVRGFKIAENQSPRPIDRVFFSFNYFDNLNAEVNRRLEAPVRDLRAYRYIGGFEKTLDDGRMSFGMRLPLNTLTAASALQGSFAKPGGTSTALGDLSVFAKFVFRENRETGSLVSAGVEVTAPTGPDTFAGAKFIQSLHTTTVQPFVGYILVRDRAYLHGFTSLQVPMDPADVTLCYNDVGVGYFLYRRAEAGGPGLVRSVAPTFEVHLSTPLNHRNPFSTFDPAGAANVVNFTYGLNVGLGRRSLLTLGVVTPVSTPKPFDFETTLLFNVYFGGRRSPTPLPPPVIGG